MLQTLLKNINGKEADVLPLPVLDMTSIKILVGPTEPLAMPGKTAATGIKIAKETGLVNDSKWMKLEEMLVQEAQGSLPLLFKPTVSLYTMQNISLVAVIAVINEPIQLSIKLCNPLQLTLQLRNVYLMWEFESTTQEKLSNENMDDADTACVKAHGIKSITLQPNSHQEIILNLTPMTVGKLILKGICYNIISSTNQTDAIQIKGKKLFDMELLQKLDNKVIVEPLSIKIVPPAPCLQVGRLKNRLCT